MNLYKQCFGSDFELGFDLNEFPFLEDVSYKNDACPSFMFKSGDSYYRLWVDFESHYDREEDICRYSLNRYEDEELNDLIENIKDAEYFSEMKEFLNKLK
jgi:hypothetical protein